VITTRPPPPTARRSTKKPDYAEAALNLGIVLQEAGDLDSAMRAYTEAYRLRPSTVGAIAMALNVGLHGRLWLDEAALRGYSLARIFCLGMIFWTNKVVRPRKPVAIFRDHARPRRARKCLR